TADETLVSPDRDTTIISLEVRDDSEATIEGLVDAVVEADGVDGFETGITGTNSTDLDFQKVAEDDLQKGEAIGILVALGVLLIVFGAVVASLVPIVLAVVSIVIALGLTALIGTAFELSFFVVNMLVMMGLAVGIDYALFIVSRFREERQRGLEVVDALGTSGATASRAVFFSGITVVRALLGMLLVPTTIFRSLALGAILVVLVSLVAALTLLPAVLRLLGDRVDALRLPFRRRRSIEGAARHGFWPTVARGVMRHPTIALVGSVGVLLALAVPFLNIKTGFAGVSTLPESFQSKRGFELLNEEFAFAQTDLVQVVVRGDASSAEVQDGIASLETLTAEDARFGPGSATVSDSNELTVVGLPLESDTVSTGAMNAVRDLRHAYIPQAFAAGGADVFVGGTTAENVDFDDITSKFFPIVLVFVLGLSFILLAVAFRSIVIPVTSILMNLVSVGAAYGLIVLVFQEGYGTSLFGFQQVPSIEAWIPLFLFTVLFGLSMDYHVFLLSRIRERYDQTRDNGEAVAFGVGSTARIITGAALIMVAVFGGFAAGDLVMFQQMGFGLGVAVLIDATIIRSVTVPAAMRLLGRWNWYLPRCLGWIPRISIEAPEVSEPVESPR
ncbi:MAG: MMPL family transporter, partial [Gaiellales bacterium]